MLRSTRPLYGLRRRLGRGSRLAAQAASFALTASIVVHFFWPSSASAIPTSVLTCSLPEDFPIPGGWFFQQGKRPSLANVCAGYSVVDDASAAMWTEYYRLGGMKVFGPPMSRRYIGPGGYIQQAFEFGVLQWRPEENRAVPALIFEQFSDKLDSFGVSFDQRLRFFSIPEPVAPPGAGFADQTAVRQSWLTDPQILSRYLTDPRTGEPWAYQEQAWEFYGLPQGPPERITYAGDQFYPMLAPFITQRFQRFAFRLFLADDPDTPDNKRGCVGTIRSGWLARQLRFIAPADAREEPIETQRVLIAETLAEQFLQPTQEGLPTLVSVVVSVLNFAPNETVTVTADPLAKDPSNGIQPWESTVSFTISTDSTGGGETTVQLWTVGYLFLTQGNISGPPVLVQDFTPAGEQLSQVETARCQALTTRPGILTAPQPFVAPQTPVPGGQAASGGATPSGTTTRQTPASSPTPHQ